MRRELLALSALAAAACGAPPSAVDGGRALLGCSQTPMTVPVTVLGLAGLPVSGAQVTATWLAYDGLTQTLVTDARGVAIVHAQLGPGVVRLRAMLNELRSEPGDLTFSGGTCVNAVSPQALTLNLEAP